MSAHRSNHVRMRNFLLGCSALASATAGSAAWAQASDEGGTLSEIVVTAQKRQQNLQDVPIAITAVTQEALQTNRVTNVMDLSGLAPGFIARSNAGSLGAASYSVRGVFATGSVPGSDRQISTYLDGVYIGVSRGSVFDLPDIERIEILRGPQGTLFGRNATAGAVSVVTRNPTGDFKVRQEVTVGNYSQLRTRTSIDLPAIGPFSGYATYVHDERNGDVKNLGAGAVWDRTSPFTDITTLRSPKRLGDRNFENIFAALKFQPVDDLSMTYKFDRSNGDFTPEARVTTVVNPASFTGQMLLAVMAAQPAGGGRFGAVTTVPSAERPKSVNNAWAVPGFQKNFGHSLTTEWRASDNISVKNITAYRKSTVFAPAVIAGLSGLEFTAGAVQPYARFAAASSVPGFFSLPAATQAGIVSNIAAALTPAVGSYFAGYEGNNYGKGWQISSETQLNYDSDFLTLTVGGLWYHSKELSSGLPGMRPNYAFAPTASPLALGSVQESRNKSTSLAAYAQGEVHVTPELDLVLGGRITRDEKSGSLSLGGTFVGSRTGAGSIVGTAFLPFEFKKTKPTFSIGVNYKPNSDTLLYGKFATAFMSGGSIGGLDFAPETVESYEAGVKSDLFDRRLRVNLAAYHATYKHSQSAQSGQNAGRPDLSTVLIDNGTLKAKGFELEVNAAPVHGLTLGASLGLMDTKLLNPNPAVVAGAGGAYVNTGVPKWTGNLNAQYQTDPVFADAYLQFRVDANWRGKQRSQANPNIEIVRPAFAPYEFLPSVWLINARAAVRDVSIGPVTAEVAVWVRNLTDDKTATYPVAFGDILHGTSFQPARTYGVDFIINF